MMSVKSLSSKILSFLPYFIVFVFSLYQPADPDLGWHLKYGEYFWQHGSVLRDNTFSTMMPNFHWANTSWLTDIISYTTFHLGGFFGLSLLSALVVMCTFYFFTKAAKFSLWEQTLVFPFILYLESPVNAVSFRGQQVVLLLIGAVFYLISRYEKKPKFLLLTIPIFWVMSAIDGEFLLGYVLFALWIVLYLGKKIFLENSFNFKTLGNFFISELKEIKYLLFLLIGIFVITLINPFEFGIYLDALSHIGNPLLKDISEYLPFTLYSQEWWNELFVGIVLVFGLFIFFVSETFWEEFPFIGGGLLLFVLSLEISRYAWPDYYLLFPLFGKSAAFLKPDGKKAIKISSTILLTIIFCLGIWLRYPLTKFTSFNWNDYCQMQVLPCSSASAEFLISHHMNHNLYSLYGWGGWLIWNYPQIKPTIDGRMHLWVQNGYSGFADYYAIEQNFKDIDKTKYDIAYMSPDKPVYKRLVQLTREGKWREVYQDQYAVIFVRNR